MEGGDQAADGEGGAATDSAGEGESTARVETAGPERQVDAAVSGSGSRERFPVPGCGAEKFMVSSSFSAAWIL